MEMFSDLIQCKQGFNEQNNMQNYAIIWKKKVNFKQVPYDNFISEYIKISNAYFLEKIDGFLSPFIYKPGNSFFQSTTGKEIRELPVINEYEAILKKTGIKDAILIGELVAQKRIILPFNITQSVVKKHYVESNKPLIHHYVYDVLELDGRTVNFSQAISFIHQTFKPETEHVHIPETQHGDLRVFRKMYSEVIKRSGIEGLVVRPPDGRAIKVKEVESFDIVVIGAGNINMPAWPKDEISYLICAFIDKDGIFRTTSKIGSGYTTKQRRTLFDFVQKNKLYEENGNLYIPPQLVVEVKAFRTQITNTIAYRYSNGKYIEVGKKTSPMLSQPSFLRIRTDKKANKFDVRPEQHPEFRY